MSGKVSALKVEGESCGASLYQHSSKDEGWQATFGEGIYPFVAFTNAGAVSDDV
jgi:hypothetical protein